MNRRSRQPTDALPAVADGAKALARKSGIFNRVYFLVDICARAKATSNHLFRRSLIHPRFECFWSILKATNAGAILECVETGFKCR